MGMKSIAKRLLAEWNEAIWWNWRWDDQFSASALSLCGLKAISLLMWVLVISAPLTRCYVHLDGGLMWAPDHEFETEISLS